ncbi:MAG TPA: tyrosine-type recombinase/integrase [Acidimicrobiia bacterium]|nr:tyrosine-type recombinase/integrase [Acidimicrobiia bacterium]
MWIPAVARANLPGLTFHDLRRANATTMVINNIDVNTAQVRLGHSDPRLTLGVYAQASSDADRAAAETLGSVLLPSTAPTRVMSPDEWLGT